MGRAHLSRWFLPATLVAALVTIAWLSLGDGWQRLSSRIGLVPRPRRITSIAVLPFENLSGGREQDYFVDGMTDALTTNLAQFKSLKVASRNSATQYRQRTKPLAQIARELNVDAVVQGAMVRSGNRMRLTVQLIDAATDRYTWAQNYEREVNDVLGLQIELAEAIAAEIHVEVRPEERHRLTRSLAVRPEAYDEYLKGRFYWSSRRPENLLRAEEHFQNAIAHDSTYARHIGLVGYVSLVGRVRARRASGLHAQSRGGGPSALALDDTLSEAHASLAGVLYRYDWNWAEAERDPAVLWRSIRTMRKGIAPEPFFSCFFGAKTKLSARRNGRASSTRCRR